MTDYRPGRICFSGTPQLAADHLAAMIAAGFVPAVVITQPDRHVGRGRKTVHQPEVKQLAQEYGIEVWQPERVRKRVFIDRFVEAQFDLSIVVAYGQILARRMFEAPARGTFNIHASLLPRWRGAAPIERALMAGDRVTGVSLQRVGPGLDEGDMVATRETLIGDDDDRASLYERLGKLGGELLVDTLPALLAGTQIETPQPADGVTHAAKLTKEDGALDFTRPARELRNRIRALHPHPGTRARAITSDGHDHQVKLCAASLPDPADLLPGDPAPGTVLDIPHRLIVATGDGLLDVTECQPTGKKPMPAAAYLNGHHVVRLEPPQC